MIHFGPNFVACSDTSPALEKCYDNMASDADTFSHSAKDARRTLQRGFFEAWLNRNLSIPPKQPELLSIITEDLVVL